MIGLIYPPPAGDAVQLRLIEFTPALTTVGVLVGPTHVLKVFVSGDVMLYCGPTQLLLNANTKM